MVWAFSNFVENLRTTISKRISIMVKNKVVIKERDAWSDLANFIGEIVAKYADAIEYYGAAEPPVRCGESHLSGLTEPPHFVY